MTARRHAAQITADRLGEAIERWPDRFSVAEIKQAQGLAHVLLSIAAHDRTGTENGWRCSCGAAVSLAGVGEATLDRLFDEHASPESPATTGDTA